MEYPSPQKREIYMTTQTIPPPAEKVTGQLEYTKC